MQKLLLSLTVIFAIAIASPAGADEHGYGSGFLKEVQETFYQNGQLSAGKVEKYKQLIEQAQSENRQNLINYYINMTW